MHLFAYFVVLGVLVECLCLVRHRRGGERGGVGVCVGGGGGGGGGGVE